MWIAVEKLWITTGFRFRLRFARAILRGIVFLVMALAGYSGTPLIKKLGIKPEHKLLLINEPADYFHWLSASLQHQMCKHSETPDFVHLFVKENKQFEIQMKKMKSLIKKNICVIIWISWYKKSAGIATDVTEDVIRNYALKNNLVDVKVCAVSDIWSGLKLVVPLKLRS